MVVGLLRGAVGGASLVLVLAPRARGAGAFLVFVGGGGGGKCENGRLASGIGFFEIGMRGLRWWRRVSMR